ncbi:MAG: hypothetical protein ACTSYK_02270 [Alphaproteobacteria bacterium]
MGLFLIGAVQLQNAVPMLGEDGLVQALRHNVWKRALADQARATRWPWQDLSTNMSLASGAMVPRLGLSAALRGHTVPEPAVPAQDNDARTKTAATATPDGHAPQGDLALSDVAIGDSITFTAADGATCVYQVTGRRVVDPHLAASEAARSGAESLFECSPLESLIRQATQDAAQSEPNARVAPGTHQQKL